MKRRIKVNGFIILLAVLLLAFLPDVFLRHQGGYFLGKIAEILGITFILLGQILRTSARGLKSEHSQGGHLLIQGGPYALTRNPMYLGILLIGLGIVLVLFKWWVVGIFLLVFVVRYQLLIFREEKKLKEQFSKEYANYQSKVPRLLPSFAALFQKEIEGCLPLKLTWLKKEIGSISAVLSLTFIIFLWRDKAKGAKGIFIDALGIFMAMALFIYLAGYLINRTNDVSGKSKGTL